MPFIDWKDSYSVGLPDIDQQHKKLVGIINRLHDAMKTGSAQALIIRVVDDLVEYTREHFAYEERMIQAAGYPHVAEHAKKHRAMVAQVQAFRERVGGTHATLPLQLMDFLKSWLTQHILSSDMDYSRVLTSSMQAARR